MDNLIAICREVDRETGKIEVYEIKAPVTDELIFKLSIRARVNPELKYYIANIQYYKEFTETMKRAIKALSRRLEQMPITEV